MEAKNKISKNTLWYIVGGIALAIGGYLLYLKKQADKLMDFTYRFANFKVLKASMSDFQLSTELVITNPSQLSFTITDYDINVEIKQTPLARLTAQGVNITIPKNQSVALPLAIQFDPRSLGASLLPLFLDVFIVNTDKDSEMGIRYVGRVSGKFSGLQFKNIPIDYTYIP